MTARLTHRWPIGDAWEAACEVTALTMGVDVDALRAPSRGRGPRPPKAAWMAKKMAVHVAVVLAECDYAVLGRLIGLHRDTIASHCAAIREACAGDDREDLRSEMLVGAASFRLEALVGAGKPRQVRRDIRSPIADMGGQLAAIETYLHDVLDRARSKLSDEVQFIRRSSDNHGVVIASPDDA